MADRVAVTGATGVVGGAAARALLARGDEVVAVQRGGLSPELGPLGALERRADVAGSVDVLIEAFAGCQAVVHAAARVDITGPWEEYERINVMGTRRVIEAARRAGVARFVLVSSPSVAHAGDPLIGAQAEPADPAHARGHYSRSKAMSEVVALADDDARMAVTILRPHLVWGPGDSQLTERIVDRARSGRLVTIGAGSALIDTTYIDNAGTAIAAAVERAALPQVRGRAFVVSNGEPRTVSEMLTRIARAAGAPGPSRSVPFPVARAGGQVLERLWERTGREGEPPVTAFLAEQLATAHWFDQRQTREALAWVPEVTIDEGLARLAAEMGGVAPPGGANRGL